jgi:hypothetical protein
MCFVIILVAVYYDLQTLRILHLSRETTEEYFKEQCREIFLFYIFLPESHITEDTLKKSNHEIKFCPIYK